MFQSINQNYFLTNNTKLLCMLYASAQKAARERNITLITLTA